MSHSQLTPEFLKKVACDAISKAAGELKEVSDALWKNPELKYEEHFAHQLLTDFLEKRGFPVERQYVLDTGFRSVYTAGVDVSDADLPNVATLCEYDALPDIGHACGHNLIAQVGVGAAIGIKAALDAAKAAGKSLGTLTVLGTPAEEGGLTGGGKIDIIHGGGLDPVDCALMAHPFPYDDHIPAGFIARAACVVTYRGKASHAAAFPYEGINALDAAVMAYNGISVLRQQMRPRSSVHGIISNGGAKPNIIPELSELEYYVRAPTIKELKLLQPKIEACFEAAAKATGCQVEIVWGDKPYDNLLTNRSLAALYEANGQSIGLSVLSEKDMAASGAVASTDMGNVSQVVPSLHPVYFVGGRAMNHTREFTALAGADKAQAGTLGVAKALAMTAIDVFCRPELVSKMKAELAEDVQK